MNETDVKPIEACVKQIVDSIEKPKTAKDLKQLMKDFEPILDHVLRELIKHLPEEEQAFFNTLLDVAETGCCGYFGC